MSSLECRICCERFESSRKVPKNLDCGHYYCLECLQKEYARRVNNFKCPECQTVSIFMLDLNPLSKHLILICLLC